MVQWSRSEGEVRTTTLDASNPSNSDSVERPLADSSFGLQLSDFAAFGEFAAAGLAATTAALERAGLSYGQSRVPIAGAAVYMAPAGELTTLAVGNNGRIPAPPGQCESPDPDGKGYPTDHGETATIRQITDVAAVDWNRVVFTTSLNPCIMCNRTLTHLWTLGLNKIVVADVSTFEGTVDTLKALEGMTVVELDNPIDAEWMTTFARTYPWDWSADIGLIPPSDMRLVQALPKDVALQAALIDAVAAALPELETYGAGVVTPDKKVAGAALDQRDSHGGNPTFSAAMMAMGRAGSAVNLRESVLVLLVKESGSVLDVAGFGSSSRGACELFRPGTLLTNASIGPDLRAVLSEAGVPVVEREDTRSSSNSAR